MIASAASGTGDSRLWFPRGAQTILNTGASGCGEREVGQGAARYAFTLAQILISDHERPTAERCQAMASWAPRVAAEGREAVARARRNGYMEGDYGLLLSLLAR